MHGACMHACMHRLTIDAYCVRHVRCVPDQEDVLHGVRSIACSNQHGHEQHAYLAERHGLHHCAESARQSALP